MSDLVLGPAVIEQARVVVAGEARRVPALADAPTAPPAASFGALSVATTLATVLTELVEALGTELDAAGTRLAQLDRALDTALTALEAGDRDAAAPLARV